MDSKVTNDQTQQHEFQEVRFSPEQYKALLALIQQPSHRNSASTSFGVKQIASVSSCSIEPASVMGKSSSSVNHTITSWILDSRATDHVSASLVHFRSYNQLNPPIMVKLLNGHLVSATHSGEICLSTSIVLSNVLYIASFTFNLISISKLVSSTNCKLIFFSTSCILQDMNTQARIGIVEVRNGLYHLIPNHITKPSVQTAITHPQCTITPIDLWHFRMGHPSFERLQYMQSSYPFLKHNKDFVCNTCYYAKHKKLPFPSSTSHALCCFDLVHIDIWGPCSKISMHGHRYFLTIVHDHSRFTWIFLMNTKAEAREHIIAFTTYVETHFNNKIKTI